MAPCFRTPRDVNSQAFGNPCAETLDCDVGGPREIVHKLPSLVGLHIDSTKITEEGVLSLIDNVQNPRSLSRLFVSPEQISDETAKKLKSAFMLVASVKMRTLEFRQF